MPLKREALGRNRGALFKGHLLCKMHFFMSFIHKYVSSLVQETHKVSENKTLSLFLRTHISKNGGTTELIQICCRLDVISEMREVFWK